MTALDQRSLLPGDLLHDRVVFRALVATDVQDISVTRRGQHACAGASVLEHGVCRNCGAVQDMVESGGIETVSRAELPDAAADTSRRVLRGSRNFENMRLATLNVCKNDIGEGAADVNAYQLHRCLPRCAPRSFGTIARHHAMPRSTVGGLGTA